MEDGVRLSSVTTLVANQTRKLICKAKNFLGTKSSEKMFFVTGEPKELLMLIKNLYWFHKKYENIFSLILDNALIRVIL